jgi:ATP-dependent helicase/DNAse subunit B
LAEFRGCPFKVFASRLLGLKEAESPSESGELDSREKGMLYHSILESFYKTLNAGGFWKGPATADWQGTLADCLRDKLPKDGWRGLGVYPVLWKSLCARMRVHLSRTLASDIARLRVEGLQPREFELSLTAMVDGIKLMGKLDRLDWDEAGTRYRVIDYKSTFHKGSLKRLAEKLVQVQAPLYLELAEAAVSALPDRAQPLSADFLAIEDSSSATGHDCIQSFTQEEWEELRPLVLDGVRRLRGMMSEGKFFVTPDEGQGKVCDYCSFGALCRKSHGMTRVRAEDSRLRAEFEAIREPKNQQTVVSRS